MHKLEAYILIGGRSSRLGRDKAFVEVGGMTLLERAVKAVRGVPSLERVTTVAGNSMLATRSIAADVPFILDLYENRGPLGGLHAALADASTPWIFVLACDYPFVCSDLISLLAGKVAEPFGAVVPEQPDGRLQPLCAFYKADTARPVVEELIEKPRVPPPLQQIVQMLRPRIVTSHEYIHLLSGPNIFTNINSPQDLEEARNTEAASSSEDNG